MEDLMGNYEDHPGHTVECPLKEKVKPHMYGTFVRGYRCSFIGGHCLPNSKCQTRLEYYNKGD